jgi:low temperature requirement protein LtrA
MQRASLSISSNRSEVCHFHETMSAVNQGRHPRLLPVSEEARVAPIELYFDLVFVFSLTPVTALMADDLTGHGIVRGLLVLALLWWSWVGSESHRGTEHAKQRSWSPE